jgi:ArsR family transcriptional regulator, virulence genes transcriptional regulator
MILNRQNQDIKNKADEAADFLKGLANPHRLNILCQLVEGEKNVTELITATNLPQTSVSQHLAKLRKEGIIDYRRDHRSLYYSISHDAVLKIMMILYESFCNK